MAQIAKWVIENCLHGVEFFTIFLPWSIGKYFIFLIHIFSFDRKMFTIQQLYVLEYIHVPLVLARNKIYIIVKWQDISIHLYLKEIIFLRCSFFLSYSCKNYLGGVEYQFIIFYWWGGLKAMNFWVVIGFRIFSIYRWVEGSSK